MTEESNTTESAQPAAKSWWKKLQSWFSTAKDSETAEKAGKMMGKAWDTTKDVADKAWEKSKDVAGDVKEKLEERRDGDEPADGESDDD